MQQGVGVMSVTYIDTRKDWMIREDQEMTCFWKCKYYKNCLTKCGADCKVLGGDIIPKIQYNQMANKLQSKQNLS